MYYTPLQTAGYSLDVQLIAIGAGGLGFDSWVWSNRIQRRQQLATAASFFRNYVAQVLSRGDGSHHSLHALA